MPRLNTDYSKIVIYKIVCNDENVEYIYVGSTTDFTKRKFSHKSICNNGKHKKYNEKKYVEMRNNGGWESFRMIEVEKYPCNDKREAEKREEELRKELKANMNSYRCFITAEERKEYYEKNKDKINDKASEKFVCPCGGKYTYCHKSEHLKSKKHLKFLESQNN